MNIISQNNTFFVIESVSLGRKAAKEGDAAADDDDVKLGSIVTTVSREKESE